MLSGSPENWKLVPRLRDKSKIRRSLIQGSFLFYVFLPTVVFDCQLGSNRPLQLICGSDLLIGDLKLFSAPESVCT